MSGELVHLAGTVGESMQWAEDRESKAIVILSQDHEGAWSGTWSRLSLKELVFAERVLRFYIDREMSKAWDPM